MHSMGKDDDDSTLWTQISTVTALDRVHVAPSRCKAVEVVKVEASAAVPWRNGVSVPIVHGLGLKLSVP
jgi:hypothetical protein